MAADRQPKMRAMIMAETEEERRAALDELLPLQQADFEGLFEEMAGLPVTIRLLDPPLHEFLPDVEEVARESSARGSSRPPTSTSSSGRSRRVHELRRPTRCSAPAAAGWRSSTPRSARCRCAAIVRAAAAVRERTGEAPQLEIMVPLVAYEKELELHARADRAGGGATRAARSSS